MNLEDYLREIEEEIQKQNNMEDALELLDKEITKFTRLFNRYQELIDQLVLPEEVALNNATAVGNDLLKEEATLAITGTEFDISEFKSRLDTAIEDSRTLVLRLTSSGMLEIENNLSITAGTLDDYAEAIKKTRNQIRARTKGRQPKNLRKYDHITDPDLAAYIWMEKYYSPARQGTSVPDRPDKRSKGKMRPNKTAQYISDYWETIRMRIANMTTLAPFWELLDLGGSTLAQDTGTKAYPVIRPTHFVNKAILRISNYFYSELQTEKKRKEKYYERYTEYDEKITALYRLRNSILRGTSAKSELEVIVQGEVKLGAYSESELRRALYAHIEYTQGIKLEDADDDKLQALVNDLVNEVAVQSRVSLTRSGARNRVRVRTTELQQIVRSHKYG